MSGDARRIARLDELLNGIWLLSLRTIEPTDILDLQIYTTKKYSSKQYSEVRTPDWCKNFAEHSSEVKLS